MFQRRVFFILCLLAICSWSASLADGTETLGPPSLVVSHGTGLVAVGTGMIQQPGAIAVEIPADAEVTQVLLYWEGFMQNEVPGDETIVIGNGTSSTEVTGALIGGPAYFFVGAFASVFRADITELALIGPGITTLEVSGLDFTAANNGAGLVVIFDDGSTDALIDIRDGSDLAFIDFLEPRYSTTLQSFTFPPVEADATAMLSLFFASVAGTTSGGTIRPTSVEITTSGSGTPRTQVLSNVLDSLDGEEWDSFTIAVDLPEGDSMLEVQAFSRDDLGTGEMPASFDWNLAAFAMEPETSPLVPGRMTGGGSVFSIDGLRVTHGLQLHCDLREPNRLQVNWHGGNKFHLMELTAAVCTDTPVIDQGQPQAPFDTFKGSGVGRLNQEPGASIEFVFVDAGEPGVNDTASIRIRDAAGNLVLDVPGDPNVPGYLDHGNHQAHDGGVARPARMSSGSQAHPRTRSGDRSAPRGRRSAGQQRIGND